MINPRYILAIVTLLCSIQTHPLSSPSRAVFSSAVPERGTVTGTLGTLPQSLQPAHSTCIPASAKP